MCCVTLSLAQGGQSLLGGDGGNHLTLGDMTQLEVVNVSGCVAVDDAFVDVLVGSAPSLMRLVVSDCEHLTDEGLAILTGAKSLQELKVDACWSITIDNEGIQTLRDDRGGDLRLSAVSSGPSAAREAYGFLRPQQP